MTFIDLFWIFFMLSALQPVLRQSMLEAMRTHHPGLSASNATVTVVFGGDR
jgi:hypothetical protein